jgi:hypothetical protein
MPENVKKEPGHPDVEHRERGDVRQQQPSPKTEQDRSSETPQDDGPPANRNPSSPWLGGG